MHNMSLLSFETQEESERIGNYIKQSGKPHWFIIVNDESWTNNGTMTFSYHLYTRRSPTRFLLDFWQGRYVGRQLGLDIHTRECNLWKLANKSTRWWSKGKLPVPAQPRWVQMGRLALSFNRTIHLRMVIQLQRMMAAWKSLAIQLYKSYT